MKKDINVYCCSIFMEIRKEIDNRSFDRNTAYIVSIEDVLKSRYINSQEKMESSYALIRGKKAIRVNLIGAVLTITKDQERPITRIDIQDWTSSMQLISFEDNRFIEEISIGDIIIVIGKIREYNNKRYIIPEIIKRIDNPKWINYRKKQIEILNKREPNIIEEDNSIEEIKEGEEEINITEESMSNEEDIEELLLPQQRVLEIIKELDKGEGADIDEVISKMEEKNAEEIIKSMLREGDIFQVKPGKIKIL